MTADVSEAYAGEKVTLTVTPAEGYELGELTIVYGEDDTEAEVVTTEETGVYTFTMPDGNVTVSATLTVIEKII